MSRPIIKTKNYLLFVSEEEIKEGDFYVRIDNGIMFATLKNSNPEIIKKHCKKIIAHLPLKNSPILDLPILAPIKVDDIFVEVENKNDLNVIFKNVYGYKEYKPYYDFGYNKAKEKYKYTADDMKEAFMRGHSLCRCVTDNHDEALESADEYIKSLSNK